MKKFIFLLVMFILITANCTSIFAHEIFGDYNRHFRWKYVYRDNMGYKYCYLKTNNDNIVGYSWRNTAYSGGLYEWNFHGGGKVKPVDHSYNGSRVDFLTKTYWTYGSSTIARTKAYANQVCWVNEQGKFNTKCKSDIISYALILINPKPRNTDKTYLSVAQKEYVISHEIGHVVGLGHPKNHKTDSVMYGAIKGHPGKNWSRPKPHDKLDLIYYYQ